MQGCVRCLDSQKHGVECKVSSSKGKLNPRSLSGKRMKATQKVSDVGINKVPSKLSVVALAQVVPSVISPMNSVTTGNVNDQLGGKEQGTNRRLRIRCWHCHKVGHRKAICFMRRRKCYACAQVGHMAENCPTHSKSKLPSTASSTFQCRNVEPLLKTCDKLLVSPEITHVRNMAGRDSEYKDECMSGMVSLDSGCCSPVDDKSSLEYTSSSISGELIARQSGCPPLAATVMEFSSLDVDGGETDTMPEAYIPFHLPAMADSWKPSLDLADFSDHGEEHLVDVDPKVDEQENDILNWSLGDDAISEASWSWGSWSDDPPELSSCGDTEESRHCRSETFFEDLNGDYDMPCVMATSMKTKASTCSVLGNLSTPPGPSKCIPVINLGKYGGI